MSISIFIAALLSAAAALAAWFMFGALVIPVASGETQSIVTVLSVTGASSSLEHTVTGLVWLARSGALEMNIIISDEGMDDETRLIASNIERRFHEVSLASAPGVSR